MKNYFLVFVFLMISGFVNSQDTDNDGVLDKYDKCPTIAGIASKDGCLPISKEIVFGCSYIVLSSFERIIEFDFNKVDFTNEAIGKLDTIILVMKDYPKSNFIIEGFIDGKEKSKKNRLLSKKRAKAVYDYLVSKGISIKKISLIDDGEDDTIIDNKIFKGLSNNKRVEISLDK